MSGSAAPGILIAQITDIHIGFAPGAGKDEFNYLRFREVLAHLKAQPVAPAALILTGDLADGGQPECYGLIRELSDDCSFPVHVIPGNHDSRLDLLKAFPETPVVEGFAHYALDFAGLRVICIDTVEAGRHGGSFCETRASWLSGELAAHHDIPTMIFMHHPPVVSGIDWMDPDPNEEWLQRFARTVEGHDQLIGIAAGHLHRPLHSLLSRIPVSVAPAVAPAVSLDLRQINPDDADMRAIVDAEPPGYSLHLWRGGSLSTHFQAVGDWQNLARFDDGVKAMMKSLIQERR